MRFRGIFAASSANATCAGASSRLLRQAVQTTLSLQLRSWFALLAGAFTLAIRCVLGQPQRGRTDDALGLTLLTSPASVGRLQDHHHPGKRQRGAGERIGSDAPEKERLIKFGLGLSARDFPSTCAWRDPDIA